MSDPVEAFAVQSCEGTLLQTPPGDSVVIKTNTSNTAGSLAVMEFVIAANSGPALHTHVRQEVCYVLEGDFGFKAGDAMLPVSARGMASGPPHAAHLPERRRHPGPVTGDHRALGSGAALRGLQQAPAGPGGSGHALYALGHAN